MKMITLLHIYYWLIWGWVQFAVITVFNLIVNIWQSPAIYRYLLKNEVYLCLTSLQITFNRLSFFWWEPFFTRGRFGNGVVPWSFNNSRFRRTTMFAYIKKSNSSSRIPPVYINILCTIDKFKSCTLHKSITNKIIPNSENSDCDNFIILSL